MPVKWTADKDSFILNHLLTSPVIKVNNEIIDGMIDSWPDAFGDKPTRKAFTEHFSKVRKANKSHTPGAGGGMTTPASTPRKTTKHGGGIKKAAGPKTPASKRKRGKTTDDSDGDSDDKSISRVEFAELGIKEEVIEDEGEEEQESPSKKPRRAVSRVKYEESDVDAVEHPSDVDEYKEADEV